MPTNDFIGFASAGSANIMSQPDFAAAAEQTDGMQSGPASSSLANKVWRQGSNMASAMGAFITSQGLDALDNGDLGALSKNLSTALAYAPQYDATVDYAVGAIVSYSNDVFIANAVNGPGSAVAAPTNNAYWSILPKVSTGTFTPTIEGGTTQGSFTYTGTSGNYVQFYDLCFVDFNVNATVVTIPTGKMIVKGLPFLPSSVWQGILINLTNNPNGPFTSPPTIVRLVNTGIHEIWGPSGNNVLAAVNFGTLSVGNTVYFRASGMYRITI